jgi:lysophospholipase L1-like esterase
VLQFSDMKTAIRTAIAGVLLCFGICAAHAQTLPNATSSSTHLVITRPLSFGMRGSDVASLQQFLRSLGYFSYSTITGYYGSFTWKAVAALQWDNGLESVGTLGPRTRALVAKLSGGATSPSPSSPTSDALTAQTAQSSATSTSSTFCATTYCPGNGYTPGFGGGGGSTPTPDTTAPSISLTSPSNGATVSGLSVSLSASASDNVAVAGVTFKVNGVTIGSEDTASPYLISWDSTATSSGSKSIVAVARDTSNNYATSSSITVTVDNSVPVVSSIALNTATSTGALITWTTDENTDSQINYGTTSAYGATTTLDSTPTASHSVLLSNLSTSTVYHYRVRSTDAQGNLTVSADQTLTTSMSLADAPTALYAVRRIGSYMGAAIRVVRASDSAEQDIGFASDGTLDVAAATSFMGASTLSIKTWYDQSGNGYDATQSVSANRPVLDLVTGQVNSFQSITFDGQNAGVITNRQLDLPTGLALATKDSSMFFVGRQSISNNTSGFASVSSTDVTPVDLLIWKVLQGLALKGSSANQTMGIYPPTNPAVFGVVTNASNIIHYNADRSQSRSAASASNTGAGGIIGNSITGTDRGNFQALAFAFYNSALSSTQVTSLQSRFTNAFNVTTTFDTMVVTDGDSIMQGTDSTLGQNETTQIYSLLKRPVRLMNYGVFGTTLQSIAALGSGRVSISNAGWTQTTKVYLQEAGINDFSASRTDVQVETDIQTNVTALTGAGYCVVLRTITPSGSITGQKETYRQSYNTWLRANYLTIGATALSDVVSDSRLQDSSNTTYFGDGLHLTNAGYAVAASYDATAINSCIP